MKFIISFIFILGMTKVESKPILISYVKKSEEALWIREMLIQDYEIPLEFIQLIYLPGGRCREAPEIHYWHLCINESGEMHEIYADDFFKLNIIPTFKRIERD